MQNGESTKYVLSQNLDRVEWSSDMPNEMHK